MRLYVFDEHRLGASDDETTVVEITELVDAAPSDRMTALIAGWDRLEGSVREHLGSGSRESLAEVALRAPQPRPRKIIAAAVNYSLHRDEMGGQSGVYRDAVIEDARTYVGFVKSSASVVGPDGAIELPALTGRRFDHEAEVGVVIGRGGRDIPAAHALDHVFGYVPLLDITLRGAEDRSYRKSFDTFTPIGPAIVTAAEVPRSDALDFALAVNGEERQRANTRDLIRSIPELIEVFSQAMTLEPGDLIATGTPEGVGPIVPGDEVVLEVQGLGTLSMPVRSRA